MMGGYTYILATKKNGTIYIGVTSNLTRRIREHKQGSGSHDGFTKKYHIKSLVYFEEYPTIVEAIEREKYLKGKTRSYKIQLIEKQNPDWEDLSMRLS